MRDIKLNINKDSKDLPNGLYDKIEDLSANGIEIDPIRPDDFPTPWDAECYIEDGRFIIDGNVGPNGPIGCSAKVSLRLDMVTKFLNLRVYANSEEDADELNEIFKEYGWI